MGIQSNLNTGISIASYLFSQSAYGKELEEKKQQKAKTQKASIAAKTAAEQLLDVKGKKKTAIESAYIEAERNLREEEKKLYQTDPSAENLERLRRTEEIISGYEKKEQQKEKANKRLKEKRQKEREEALKREQERIAISNRITRGLNQTYQPKITLLTAEEKALISKQKEGD